MAKQIIFSYEGKDYTLEYTRHLQGKRFCLDKELE